MYKWLGILIVVSVYTGCSTEKETMNIKIQSNIFIDTMSSGSGLAVVDGEIYIVGDDSPYLFHFSKDLIPVSKYLLLEDFARTDRIPKKIKPDFESIAELKTESEHSLLIFGSGTKSLLRDYLIRVHLSSPKQPLVYSLTPLYDRLAKLIESDHRRSLNIEGSVVIGNKLFLLNRGENTIFILELKQFMDLLDGHIAVQDLSISFNKVELPIYQGVSAGFSGACYVPDKDVILFCASLEATGNWIDDGKILGSYIGALDPNNPLESMAIELIRDTEGNVLKEKVESIDLVQIEANGDITAMSVADNDDGASSVLELRISRDFFQGLF